MADEYPDHAHHYEAVCIHGHIIDQCGCDVENKKQILAHCAPECDPDNDRNMLLAEAYNRAQAEKAREENEGPGGMYEGFSLMTGAWKPETVVRERTPNHVVRMGWNPRLNTMVMFCENANCSLNTTEDAYLSVKDNTSVSEIYAIAAKHMRENM